MAQQPKVTINQKALLIELGVSEPVLKRVAEDVLREAFFEPAVAEMKAEVEGHPVTNEIAGGAGAPNISGTLEGTFREEAGDTPPNLWGFIGFDAAKLTPEGALEPILERLDPSHPDGPKMVYKGKTKDSLTFTFEIRAPSEEKIYGDRKGHFAWAPGLSWIRRIEQGIPGVAQFLNVDNRPGSRSGGGVQSQGQVRSGARFRPTSYLSKIFNNFLRRAGGREATGRSPLS